jgi:potassium-transporting ATPase KdpC subunit
MNVYLKVIKPALICFACLTIVCGLIYTGLVTVIAQIAFPEKANGSIIKVTLNNGTVVAYGSDLIAQTFSKAEYLIGRPSGTTNLSPVSREEADLVQSRILWLQSLDPENDRDIPKDLLTASGSGVDPYISPAAADYQVPRIARIRGISEDHVREIIKKYTTQRFLGIWGEPGVNVLKVNLALDGLLK